MARKIEGAAVEAVMGGDGGVGGPGAEVVEGEFDVRDEVIPSVGGERDVRGGECGEEVIFGCANVSLSGECAVIVRGG